MALPAATLDHVVINASDEIDRSLEIYKALGFTLTPRGYHSLGSVNHLAMFGTDYLELIALPKGATTGRLDLLTYPEGLNGLVFGAEDSADTYASLTAAGVPVDPPVEFTRPVALAGGSRDARFRTVRMKPGVVPYGRVYYCHHFTRDLVWRDEWRHHANGTVAIARMTIVEPEPAAGAKLYAQMFGPDMIQDLPGGKRVVVATSNVDIFSPSAFASLYGKAAPDAAGRSAYMAGLTLRTSSLAKARAALKAGGIKGVIEDAHQGVPRLVVPASEAVNTVLEFVA